MGQPTGEKRVLRKVGRISAIELVAWGRKESFGGHGKPDRCYVTGSGKGLQPTPASAMWLSRDGRSSRPPQLTAPNTTSIESANEALGPSTRHADKSGPDVVSTLRLKLSGDFFLPR